MRYILKSNLREIKKYYKKRSTSISEKYLKTINKELQEWIKDSFDGNEDIWSLPDLTRRERLDNFCRSIKKRIP